MISAALERLDDWCARQPGVRLALGPPLPDDRIDALPALIAERNPGLTVPFAPADLPIPPTYREFLRICSSARVEYRDAGAWATYEPVNVFDPDGVAEGRSFTRGATLGDREISTTFLVAFATAGYWTEASRWCFYTGTDLGRHGGEPPILLECNDFACDLARYVDTGEWVEDAFCTPAAPSFGHWLDRLVTEVTSRPFVAGRCDDGIPDAFFPEP